MTKEKTPNRRRRKPGFAKQPSKAQNDEAKRRGRGRKRRRRKQEREGGDKPQVTKGREKPALKARRVANKGERARRREKIDEATKERQRETIAAKSAAPIKLKARGNKSKAQEKDAGSKNAERQPKQKAGGKPVSLTP